MTKQTDPLIDEAAYAEEILGELLEENAEPSVREWTEDRFEGTSLHYREQLWEWSCPPVTVKVPSDVYYLPLQIDGRLSAEGRWGRLSTECVFLFDRAEWRQDRSRWVLFATYKVEC